MIKNLGRSILGSIRWVGWLVALALVINVALLCAVLITPALFYFFWRASTTAEVFETIGDKIADRIAEEIDKAQWKVELEIEDDQDVF